MNNVVQACGDPVPYSLYNCYYPYSPVPLTPAYISPPIYYTYPVYQNNYSELNLMTMVIQNMQKQLDEMQKTIKELRDKLNAKS